MKGYECQAALRRALKLMVGCWRVGVLPCDEVSGLCAWHDCWNE